MMASVSFVLFLSVFSLVGILASRKSTGTTEDYLVAGRSVSPWLTALSSVATNNSGFMFIGLLGFAYRFGVQAIWLQLGWILGDLAAWLWVHRRVRAVSGRLGVASVPALLGTRDDGSRVAWIVPLAGLLTFFFLGGYAAAQFRAGSTALEQLFGWPNEVGAILGAIIVVAYCFSGGIRASIWTDAAQAFVMLGAMLLLTGAAAIEVGGPTALFAALASQDPALVRWIPPDLAFGFGLYVLGFAFGGLGAIGQPHILVRSMAIESPEAIPAARRIYFAWFVPFNILAVAAGLYGRVLLPDLLASVPVEAAASAAERTLPMLADMLLPQFLVGLVLAGLFSATISTADSQVLACSAVITQDIAPQYRQSSFASKVATLSVTALALGLALFARGGVFDLVLVAWSALGATIGPLILLRVFNREVYPLQGVAMMIAGLVTVFAWGGSAWSGDIFKLLPGFLVPLLIYAISTAFIGTRLRKQA